MDENEGREQEKVFDFSKWRERETVFDWDE